MITFGDPRLPRSIWLRSKIAADGCWLYLGPLVGGGYAQVKSPAGRTYLHVWSYELFVGRIPDDLEIDHHCRVRHCFNPVCLEAVTHAVNMARSGPAVATHCKRGHAFTDYRKSDGRRACVVCTTLRLRARRRSVSLDEYVRGEAAMAGTSWAA
jgi:hypothetical protein